MTARAWTPQEHPRLFFGREDLEGLRAKRSVDEVARSAWGRLEEGLEEAMALDVLPWSDRWEWDTGADNQKCLGAVSADCLRAVWSLGFSWLLDRVEAHARKVTDLLMAVCDFDYWTSPRFFGTDYRLPWRGTLETANLCRMAACGYDWVYDFMSETERHRLRTCLLYKGILPLVQDWADPLTRLPLSTHILPWGNWWQNCIAPAGEAAMALYGEHPLAERFGRLCKEASDWFFRFEGASVPDMPEELLIAGDVPGMYYPPNFDSEGGYCEGLGYMDGVLINSFHFGEAYRRQTGEESLPMGLMGKVAEFILDGSFRMGDRMRAANFGDCREGWATIPIVTAYLARKLRHPGLQWFLHSCQNNFNEASLVRYFEIPSFTFLWYDPTLRPEEPKETRPVKVYPGVSWAVMRSGWGHDDSMLVLKCGATAGHAHADAGSLVLYSRDELLLIDSGVCGYEMPEYQDYYHTTRAHNTVLVGGEGQVKRLAGKIVEEAGVPGLGFVLGDATAPYEGRLGRFLRGVLFIGGTYYVVADWLRKQGDEPFQWLLHYDGEMTEEDEGFHIRKGKANLLVKVIEPAECHVAVRHGYKSYHEDFSVVKSTKEKQKELPHGDYLEITPARKLRRQNYLTVLYPFPEGSIQPRIEKLDRGGWTGLRVHRDREVDLVGLRRAGARKGTALEGVETDAALFCVTWDEEGKPLRALMRAGTYLKLDGKLIASSPAPGTVGVVLETDNRDAS
ncbi:MAG: heparinase II/III-family protein [Firmicutes bacterium]|nr:heparinase II/III-family protein [Bacillota bacterium]